MYFEVNYSFMKLFFQNLKFWLEYGDVINPKLARKRAQTRISSTDGDREMKIKSKRWDELFVYETIFSKSWNSSPILSLISPFVRDVRIRTFLDQIWG